MTHFNKSNLWKFTLALLTVVLCVTLSVGVFAFAADGDSGETPITVTGVELKDGAQVYDDHTATTIKDVLIVTGTVNGVEGQELAASQYSVTFADGKTTPTAGTGVTIMVGDYSFLCEEVFAAELLKTRIIAINEYLPSGNYFINGGGYYAFVQGMTAEQVQARLAVELVYSNHTEYKAFGNGVNWDGSAPQAFGDTSNNNDANIALSLKVDGIDDPVTGDVTFAASKTVGLKLLDDWTQPTTVTPATTVQSFAGSLQSHVVEVLNSGIEGSMVNVETDLNYNGLYVGATAEALNCSNGDIFHKDLEIPAKNNVISSLIVPLEVTFTGFAGVNSRLSQSGLGVQTARSDKVNLGEVYATVLFVSGKNEIETQLYLKDIPGVDGENSPVTATFYEGEEEVDSITRQLTDITLTFTAPDGTKATRNYSGIQISPMTVSAPSVKDTELTYSNQGCFTEVEGLIEDDPDYGDDMIISAVSDGAEVQSDGKTIKFSHGGTFTITVTFTKGSSSDFVFQQGSGNGEVNASDPTMVTYTVNVLKAPIAVSLNNFQSEYQYGAAEPAYIVHGEASDTMKFDSPKSKSLTSNPLPLPANFVLPAENDKTNGAGSEPSFVLYYTGTLADGTTKYQSYSFPKERGSYQVHVITAETGWYDAGKLETPFEFDIVERRLTLGDISIPSVKYQQGKSYTLNEVLSTVTVNNLVNPDQKGDVLSWDWAAGGANPQHAGDYDINFTIEDDNYKWEGTDNPTKQATFTIEALNLGINVSISGSSFVYGAVTPSPTLTYTKDGATVSDIYAVVSDAQYYKVEGSNETLVTEPDLNKWDIGTYKVKYTTSVDTVNGDVSGDYNLPTTEQMFTVTRRALTKVSISGTAVEYTGSAQMFTVTDWSTALAQIVNGDTNVLTISATGTLFNGNAVTTNITNNQDGTIKVVEAGTYVFTVTINNGNYKWAGEAENATSEVVGQGVTYVIDQKTLALSLDNDHVDFDGDNHVPTVKSATIEALGFTFTATSVDYYRVTGTETKIAASDIVAAGTYYVRVRGFDIAEKIQDKDGNDAYSFAVNYKLPTAPDYLVFTINVTELVAPTWDVSSLLAGSTTANAKLTYNGSERFIKDYITDWEDNYVYAGSGDLKVTFAITKDGANATLKGAGDYVVTITPAESYKWVGGSTAPVTLNVNIAKLAIVITWNEDSFGSYVYNGNAQKVVLNTNYTLNNQGSDVIDVTFDFSGAKITDGKAINAGTYTATLSGVTGAAASNYTITGAVNPSHSLTIAKYSLAVPEIKGDTTVEFNVKSKDFTLQDTSSVTGFNWDSALNVSVASQWKFNGTEYGAHPANSVVFSFATAKLTFSHAGEYVVTFTIANDDGNYQWADNLTGAQTRTLIVNRQKVTAPALRAQRTIEYNNGAVQYPTGLTVAVSGVTFTTKYGTKQNYATVTDDANSANYGLYFIKLSINGSYLDYEWEKNTSDNTNMSILDNASVNDNEVTWTDTHQSWGHTVYTADESSIYLHYMITKGILHVEYTVENYVFGDNGYSGSHGHAIAGKTDPVLWGGDDKTQITAANGTESLAFYKFDSLEQAQGRPSNIGDFTPYADLVNGLPWEVGYYGVLVTITFPANSPFETITEWYSFEVTKRVIEASEVTWTGDQTVAYDGQTHGLTATVTIEIKKADDTDVVKVPALTAALNANGDLPTNADANAYTLNAYIVTSSDNASNFALASGISNTLTINKRTVKLNVVDNSYGSVYGNALTYASATWAYVTDCPEANKFVEDATNYITYKLYSIGSGDTKGSVITSATPNAGAYWLVPELTASAQSNYELDCDYSAVKYTVAQRRITVTFNASNAKSVYGATITLSASLYSVTWNNPDGAADATKWLVGSSVSNVFTLTTNALRTSNVGTDYTVTLTVKDSVNYEITVKDEVVATTVVLGNWEITPATITTASVTQKATPTYDGQEHAIIGGLVEAKATLTHPDTNRASIKWYYTTASLEEIEANTAEWIEVTSLKQTDAINRNYYFKVTANNHNDKIVGACDVVINKAQLKVSINLSIWYGEANPANYLGTNVAYNATITELLKADTSGAMYAVSGFQTRNGVLETIGDIIDENSGAFTYTTTYNQGNNANGTYYITFVNTDLTATNYEFVNDDTNKGVLTVKKLMLDVVINDISNVYYDTYGMVEFVTVVTLPNSTYTGMMLTAGELYGNIYNDIYAEANSYDGANVFTLTTAAFADTNPDTHSKPFGDYVISGSVTDNNYDASFVGETAGKTPNHAITKATLTPETINGYIAVYDEAEHNLLYVVGASSFATASDGSTVNAEFYVKNIASGEVFADDASKAMWDTFGAVLSSNPASIDVCHKAVYYRLFVGDNYEDIYGVVEAQITPAENAFTADGVFGMAKDTWTYGLYSSSNTNGYRETTHKVTNPVAKFDRKDGVDGANEFTAVLSVKGGDELLRTDGTTLLTASSLIAEAWARGLFNVGTYVLSVEMPDTDNYTNSNVNKSVEFTVNPKELTITANNQTVIYGYDFTADYTYTVTGYVVSSTGGTAENADIAFAGMNTKFFTTSYAKGRENGSVGKYNIVTTINAIASKGNYTFTYVTANKALTVTPREVTIKIDDKNNQYNEANAGATELKYTVVSDVRFYEEDSDVIVLRTLAIAGHGIDELIATTNNVIVATRSPYGQALTVAAYPIYAIFGSEA